MTNEANKTHRKIGEFFKGWFYSVIYVKSTFRVYCWTQIEIDTFQVRKRDKSIGNSLETLKASAGMHFPINDLDASIADYNRDLTAIRNNKAILYKILHHLKFGDYALLMFENARKVSADIVAADVDILQKRIQQEYDECTDKELSLADAQLFNQDLAKVLQGDADIQKFVADVISKARACGIN